MPTLDEHPLQTASTEAAMVERRREGRLDYSNPHLIDLLRRPTEAPAALQPMEPYFRQVDKAGAVFVAATPSPVQRSALPYVIASSACLWAVITAVLWRIFE